MSYSLIDTIGNTPLVEIRRVNPNPNVQVLAKLEYFNPGGSIKDRAALYMVEDGEARGALTPDKTVIEATSGNTGIGLAVVCAVKGYRLLLAMSESVSIERQKIIEARGAEILLTPGHLSTDGAIEEVYRLVREDPDRYFMADQFNNEANWKAHYHGTAEEVWEQTGGRITTLVATLGTSGTLMGMARRLKEYNRNIQIVGVEPYLGHKIQGLKNVKESYPPEIFDKKRLDRKVHVEDDEAFQMTRRLAREEGLFVGMSSGAAMAIACKEAEGLDQGVIVAILPDSGERYLSTPLFETRHHITPLKLYNTLSRSKEPFEPIDVGKATVYSCGPTAHARINLGECRRFVFADLLVRYLQFRGHKTIHVMNITDLDDKTIAGSERAGMALEAFTQRHIDEFHSDVAGLGLLPANVYPRASEHIDDMIAMGERLVKRGFAYEKLRSLYFNISRFNDYGKLSGIDLDKIKLGATVDLDDYEKDNPRDFTLFKRCRLSELKRGIFVKTEWGNVRPSWHLQCVAMSMKHLGNCFDIHTGGREHTFPHHENEIAIAAALNGEPLARYWVHCDPAHEDSKTADRQKARISLSDVTAMGYTHREIRYWLMGTHYRKSIFFSKERMIDAGRALKRLDTCLRSLNAVDHHRPYAELDQLIYDLKQGFTTAMDDDLNIAEAMAAVFNSVRHINSLLQDGRIDREAAERLIDAFRGIDTVLNIFDFGDFYLSPEVRQLLTERDNARQEKNWARADAIREQLIQMGVDVRDRRV
ncbi:Cysteine synthase (EC [Olavius algarvensis associated proteobacterium Delta 3]|nr:Cysteine synthase (EC [Olavius algarvensis associated proteobacterium Delta 3]